MLYVLETLVLLFLPNGRLILIFPNASGSCAPLFFV
jgi:hypothetical protein